MADITRTAEADSITTTDTRAVTGKRSDLFYVDAGQFEYVIRPRTAGISLRIKY